MLGLRLCRVRGDGVVNDNFLDDESGYRIKIVLPSPKPGYGRPANMASNNTAVQLTADEIDDLLYYTRANEIQDLQQTVAELSKKYQTSPKAVFEASIDPQSNNTVLHFCSANGLVDLLPSILAPDSASKLSSDFVNHANKEGNTALHWAAYNGHLSIVKSLIAAGANMWVKNVAGHLAMFEAERADKSEVVQYLLEAGGDEVEETGSEQPPSADDIAEVEAAGPIANRPSETNSTNDVSERNAID